MWVPLGINSGDSDNENDMPHNLHYVLTAAGWGEEMEKFVSETDFIAIIKQGNTHKEGLGLAKNACCGFRAEQEEESREISALSNTLQQHTST